MVIARRELNHWKREAESEIGDAPEPARQPASASPAGA
jgi:hypothetical protein